MSLASERGARCWLSDGGGAEGRVGTHAWSDVATANPASNPAVKSLRADLGGIPAREEKILGVITAAYGDSDGFEAAVRDIFDCAHWRAADDAGASPGSPASWASLAVTGQLSLASFRWAANLSNGHVRQPLSSSGSEDLAIDRGTVASRRVDMAEGGAHAACLERSPLWAPRCAFARQTSGRACDAALISSWPRRRSVEARIFVGMLGAATCLVCIYWASHPFGNMLQVGALAGGALGHRAQPLLLCGGGETHRGGLLRRVRL